MTHSPYHHTTQKAHTMSTTTTTAQVWSSLPYHARAQMIPVMNLTDAANPALLHILGQLAACGSYSCGVIGRADGYLAVESFDPLFGGVPDIRIDYCGDSFDLYAFGDPVVSGALHTLRRVLLTRLCRRAAKIPRNA